MSYTSAKQVILSGALLNIMKRKTFQQNTKLRLSSFITKLTNPDPMLSIARSN